MLSEEGMEPVTLFPCKDNRIKYFKFPMELGKVPTTLLLVRSKLTTAKILLHVTPNQPFVHGSPISQFAEFVHLSPLVEL